MRTPYLALPLILALSISAEAALSTYSASFDFQDLYIAPASGTLEVLSSVTPEIHLKATSTLDWPTTTPVGAQDSQQDFFLYKFIIHPDANHQVGDFVATTFTFLMAGATEAVTPAPASRVYGYAEVEGVAVLFGRLPPGQIENPDAVLDIQLNPFSLLASAVPGGSTYDSGDFLLTNWDIYGPGDIKMLAYGYEYTFAVSGMVRADQLESPESVPDSGHSLAMLSLSMLGMGLVARQVRTGRNRPSPALA